MFRRFQIGLALSLGMMGCAKQSQSVAKVDKASISRSDTLGRHGDDGNHAVGPHGGVVLEFGKNHAEICIDPGMSQVTVWIVDESLAKLVPIHASSMLFNLTELNQPFELKADPHPSDPKNGMSSRFVAKHANFATDRRWSGTVSVVIHGKPYAMDFKDAGSAVASNDPKDDELYLKPGGIYTEADIVANGRTTVSAKYKTLKVSHDIKPKSGDRLCPVTLTKANAKLTWVIAGKTYEFCCPPCVDEFVATAKTNPADVKSPDEYVKK